jgi:hypothetical protein
MLPFVIQGGGVLSGQKMKAHAERMATAAMMAGFIA